MIRLSAPDPVDVRRIRVVARSDEAIAAQVIRGGPVDVTRVADYDVVPVVALGLTEVRDDGVGVDTAENDIATHAGGNLVRSADQGLDGLNQTQGDRLSAEVAADFINRGSRDPAVVAKDQVVAIAGHDRVTIGRVGLNGA